MTFVTGDQIVAHLVGDYIIQSDWMATEKTKRSVAAGTHAVTYTLPFLFLTLNPMALLIIAGTHFVIDRWRLARFVCWAKNYPWPGSKPWRECSGTGYPDTSPPWLSTWLLIIADNTMHLLCNATALWWMP